MLAKLIDEWKQQLVRASACVKLFDSPLLQEPEIRQTLMQEVLITHNHLAEAVRALDYTREYTIKMIGHAGAGKSTLLSAFLGRDVLPRGFGGAYTGIRTCIRLCSKDDPEQMIVKFLTRPAFDQLLQETKAQSLREQQTKKASERGTKTKEEGPFTRELRILEEAKTAYANEYLSDAQPKTTTIPVKKWKTEGYQYIEEPPKDDLKPRLVRLVDSVEFSLHADDYSLLPERGMWVDLPGGSEWSP